MFSLFSKKSVVVVHDGRFHADDIFACAVLSILLDGRIKIVRTRDQQKIDAAEYVADVGGIYDPLKKRFDHHQAGGAGVRENGIPYAAFGLVWKEYGVALSGSVEAARRVEEKLVYPIDAGDNAYDTFSTIEGRPLPYLINSAFAAFMPTWQESDTTLESFLYLVSVAKKILEREIKHARDFLEAKAGFDRIYQAAEDKRLLVLDRAYPWEELALAYPESLFVVVSRHPKKWKAEGTLVAAGHFDRRAYFPKSWAGLRGEALEKATGVTGATFCHNGRFICAATSREAAITLAKLALNAKES